LLAQGFYFVEQALLRLIIPRFRAHRNEQVLHCARLASRLKPDNPEHQTMRCHEEYPQLKMRIVSLINDAQFIERGQFVIEPMA